LIAVFILSPGEELVKKTKPHSASFLSSPFFWVGMPFLLLGYAEIFVVRSPFMGLAFVSFGTLMVAASYLRRVTAYTFYFTNRRVVSSYSFFREAYREIYYDRMIEAKMIQGIFGKIGGYGDVWFYGHQSGWIVGRMRGVRLGDWEIVANKAWNSVRNS
jgi:hypothetical protein